MTKERSQRKVIFVKKKQDHEADFNLTRKKWKEKGSRGSGAEPKGTKADHYHFHIRFDTSAAAKKVKVAVGKKKKKHADNRQQRRTPLGGNGTEALP